MEKFKEFICEYVGFILAIVLLSILLPRELDDGKKKNNIKLTTIITALIIIGLSIIYYLYLS